MNIKIADTLVWGIASMVLGGAIWWPIGVLMFGVGVFVAPKLRGKVRPMTSHELKESFEWIDESRWRDEDLRRSWIGQDHD